MSLKTLPIVVSVAITGDHSLSSGKVALSRAMQVKLAAAEPAELKKFLRKCARESRIAFALKVAEFLNGDGK